MAREGTRSSTGNAKPRVIPVVDTAPVIKRTKTTKKKVVPESKAKKAAAKPAAKKRGAPKKETAAGVAKKVCPPPLALSACIYLVCISLC